ncbi:MAG: ATP-binding protein [bacterium]
MGETFTYFSISGLINALTSLGFAVFLMFTSFRNRTARYLIYMCVALGSWSVCYFFWQIAVDAETALFWARGLMFGAIFTSISFFHLVLVFLKLDDQRFYKIVLIIFYIFTFAWVGLNFTPYFVAGVEHRSIFIHWPVPGPFYLPFLTAFGVHVIYAVILLYKKYKKSTGIIRRQTLMLMLGITATFIGGSTNYFLWYNIPVDPWGNGIASFHVIMCTYAIMRYGLLNMKVVVAEIFTAMLIIVLTMNAFLSKTSSALTFSLFILGISAGLGMVLIRSVRKEVKRREELSRLTKSLEKANIRLKELDKQKTEFLSIASHQLRTPLSILNGYIELIKDGSYGKPTRAIVQVLKNMDESNGHLVKLVEDFLNVSRIEQGRTKFEYENIDMISLIDGVVGELKQRGKDKGLKVSWKKVGKGIKLIYGDAEKIRHVLFNFIDNAIKYSDKGMIQTDIRKERNGLAVRVIDNGLGFNKTDEMNFFQKFYRGENVKGVNVNGTGLGLFVCKMFIEAHRGRIWAHSEGKGKGSEFGFWIPYNGNEKNGKK